MNLKPETTRKIWHTALVLTFIAALALIFGVWRGLRIVDTAEGHFMVRKFDSPRKKEDTGEAEYYVSMYVGSDGKIRRLYMFEHSYVTNNNYEHTIEILQDPKNTDHADFIKGGDSQNLIRKFYDAGGVKPEILKE